MFGFGIKKTAVLVFPPKLYDESEVHILEKILKKYHIRCTYAASFANAPITSMRNEKIKPEIKISDINFDKIDAVIMVGGEGVRQNYNDTVLHKMLKTANELDKTIAAIDYAPMILAHSEILKHRCATCMETEEQKTQTSGAHYTAAAVEVDGNIITGKSPRDAVEFAETTAQVIAGKYIPAIAPA